MKDVRATIKVVTRCIRAAWHSLQYIIALVKDLLGSMSCRFYLGKVPAMTGGKLLSAFRSRWRFFSWALTWQVRPPQVKYYSYELGEDMTPITISGSGPYLSKTPARRVLGGLS